MYNHGIQIFIEGHWVTIPAESREVAIRMRDRSIQCATCPVRRVLVLENGHTIITDAE